MEYNSKSLTREGATMLALADKEEKALIIDEVIVSEKVITAGTDISALTMADFANPLSYGISSKVQSDNQFSVKSVITNHWQDSANTDHTTNKDFNVALVGVVAHVDSFVDQHVLTVAVGNDPFVLPAYQGTDVSFVFGITQAYSASQNVTIKMDGSAYALATDLDDIKNLQGSIGIAIDSKLADYVKTDDVKSLIPATVIDGSKPADFKEAVTLEKGAVDGEGNAIATSKDVSDGDATTLKSAKEYADTKVSGKADDSTVVHTADMRKPANQVASIDEVSTLQTQVNNSAVGTNLLLGTSNVLTTVTNATGWSTRIPTYHPAETLKANQTYTVSCYLEPTEHDATVCMGTSNGNIFGTTIAAGSKGISTLTTTLTPDAKASGNFWISFTSAQTDNSAVSYKEFKLEKGSVATDWCPNPEDKVNVADMRKPASDVAGIEEVNAKQDKIGYTPADDSKVAHLSGANNFDTVPTVNNNPLLLASSLPSDLARLSQDANFTAKLQQNGQDVALVNNTIARNPDTGVVSEPTDFINLTVNGGKSVATRDDLKSLEASTWLSLGMPKGSYKTDSLSIDHIFLGSPLYMKYDTDTETTTLSGSFLLGCALVNVENVRSWNGALITLPDGFYVSDEDLIEFVKFLVSDTSGVEINSASKSGNDIIASLKYTNSMVPMGYTFGVTVSGAYGSNFRQYVTNKTTKLIKKV